MDNPYSRQLVYGPLSRYVRSLHIADEPSVTLEIDSPPTGYPVLGHIFRGFAGAVVEDETYPAMPMPFNILAGQLYRKRGRVKWADGIGHVAAELTATGLWELFHNDGSGVINAALPLELLAPQFDQALTEAFSRHGPDPATFEVALKPLMAQARSAPDIIRDAVRRIEAAHGVIRVNEIFSDAGGSLPTLNRQFRTIVGLPPKYFARVVQFNHVAGLISAGDTVSIAELAAEAGYYDQAHFTRVVSEFVLKTPGAFLKSDVSRISTFVRLSH